MLQATTVRCTVAEGDLTAGGAVAGRRRLSGATAACGYVAFSRARASWASAARWLATAGARWASIDYPGHHDGQRYDLGHDVGRGAAEVLVQPEMRDADRHQRVDRW